MAEPFFDPISFWRDLVDQAQKQTNEFAKEGMQSEQFSRVAAQSADAGVASKEMTQALMKKYFELLDLPSRRDIQALDERLQAIEDRLIDLAETLNQGADRRLTSAVSGVVPTRTRKPPPAAPQSPNSARPPGADVEK